MTDNIIIQNILLLGCSIPKFYYLITIHNVIPLLFQYSCVATRTLFQGGQNYILGGQNFWDGLLFSEFSVDLQKKKEKKVFAPNWSSFLQS